MARLRAVSRGRDVKTLFVSMPSSTPAFTPDYGRGVIAKPLLLTNLQGVVCCMAWDGSSSAQGDTIELNEEWMKLNGVENGDYVQVEVLNYEVPPCPRIVLKCRNNADYQVH